MSNQTTSRVEQRDLPPNYFYHACENGLEIVGQRMPSLASTTFGIQIAAGIRDEPVEKLGLTYLLSEMMFQGTTTRSVRQLTEDFEAIGARKGGDSAVETARYTAQIVSDRFDRAMELMADVVLHPAFPAQEFEQMRAIQLQEINRREDEPMRRIFDLVREEFYKGTALGRRALGTRESVEALTPEDLRAFWEARYHPSGSLVAIAGNFDWEAVVARIEEQLGGWHGQAAPSPRQEPHPEDAIKIEYHDGNQEHIGLAFPFPRYGDPDYYAASLASEILGGGMTSRLFREVREKRGLVYSVAAMFAPNGNYGAEYLYAGTTPEKARDTTEVMIAELARLRDEGVTEDELARAKVQLKSELVMRGESSGARMGALARSWWFERRLTTIQELKDAIDSVTTGQILGLLRRFPPMRPLVVGAIGPRSQEELIGDALSHR